MALERRILMRLIMLSLTLATAAAVAVAQQPARKTLIAHRGASGYAPEHTVAAYTLAISQGADFVEQDLQITKDGVLVCLHDLTLERTTNVEDVFPDRSRADSKGAKTWAVSDFTAAEIRQLDAGIWFDPKFKGQRVPTWQEAIDLIRGKAGFYPETKGPDVYGSRGFDMEGLVMAQLKKNGLDQPGADPKTPVIIQSFSADSLKKMRGMKVSLPLVFLISDGDPDRGQWLTDAGLRNVAQFAAGIGPAKALLTQDQTLTSRAHALGLTVTPYTFRSAAAPRGRR